MDSVKRWWRKNRPAVLGPIASLIARFIGATFRIKEYNTEYNTGVQGGKIICGWHGRSMVASILYRNRGYWVIISKSKDGDIQTRIFEKLGFRVIRGSTGRGGERALIESIRKLREGETMAITPDGPRGPAHVVQGGVMAMAKKTGVPLVPVGISARPRTLVNSWDKYMLPWIFCKAVLIFGPPIYVSADADETEVERVRLQLQSEINRLEEEAERLLGFAVNSH